MKKLINGEWLTRDECFEKHNRLIHKISHRFKKAGMQHGFDYMDIYHFGVEGFLKAFERYEEEKGFRFATYVMPCVKGEILKSLRDAGTLLHHKRQAKVLTARIRKEDMVHEKPYVIASHFEVDYETALEAIEILRELVQSMSETISSEGKRLITLEDAIGETDDHQHVYMNDFASFLTKRQRLVLAMSLKDIPQREIAEAAGVSQVQISRELKIIRKAYERYEGESA